jgi:crotonobetainyl-CoA:carnitine CoA-transferase CaiB-like acyl-CoA transferase
MAVGALEIKFWELCCTTLGRDDLKYKHWSYGQEPGGIEAQTIKAELDGIFVQRTMAEWTAIFADVDCCVTPILRTDEAMSHPLFIQRKMISQDKHPTEGDYWRIASGVKMRE